MNNMFCVLSAWAVDNEWPLSGKVYVQGYVLKVVANGHCKVTLLPASFLHRMFMICFNSAVFRLALSNR
jgi:hypothetical protein